MYTLPFYALPLRGTGIEDVPQVGPFTRCLALTRVGSYRDGRQFMRPHRSRSSVKKTRARPFFGGVTMSRETPNFYPEPAISKFLFASKFMAPVWAVIRIYYVGNGGEQMAADFRAEVARGPPQLDFARIVAGPPYGPGPCSVLPASPASLPRGLRRWEHSQTLQPP